MAYIAKRLVFIGLVILLIAIQASATTLAQSPNESCQFLQNQIAVLEGHAAEYFAEVVGAQNAYNAATAQLPYAFESIQQQVLAGQRPNMTPQERSAWGSARLADFQSSLALADLLNVFEQIEAFEGAAFFICEQGDIGAGTGQTDGAVIENTLPEGGDEIILSQPPTPIGGTTEDTNLVGGYSGRVNVAVPADDPSDGWSMRVNGFLTLTNLDTGVVEEKRTTVHFTIGDDGSLFTMVLFFWGRCGTHGNLTFNENTFDLDFSGFISRTSVSVNVQAQGQILDNVLDEDRSVPVALTATMQRVEADGTISQTGTFISSSEAGDGETRIVRHGTAQERSANQFCGDGKD